MPSVTLLEHPDIIGTVERIANGAEIERRRHKLGWSQRDLAERAGVSEGTVQNAERRTVNDRSYSRIMDAIEGAEAEWEAAHQPEMVSVEQIITTADGPVRVVVTGARDSVSRMDFTHLIAGALRKDDNN